MPPDVGSIVHRRQAFQVSWVVGLTEACFLRLLPSNRPSVRTDFQRSEACSSGRFFVPPGPGGLEFELSIRMPDTEPHGADTGMGADRRHREW